MGGDNAPGSVVGGLSLLLKQDLHIEPILIGDEARIMPFLKKHKNLPDIRIVHTDVVVSADEKPIVALKKDKNSSMRLAIDMVNNNEADAVVSAGNSGALMVMSLMVLKTVEGISRPALVAIIPTEKAPICMLDLGANIDCSAKNLVQFALMGDAFARLAMGKVAPTIGLINVGEEQQKGNVTLQETASILANPDINLNYGGFVEGDDILRGVVDVVVTDGFVGNVVLKSMEGTVKMFSNEMKQVFQLSFLSRLGYLFAYGNIRKFRDKYNHQRHNGAVLLGLNGIVVKSHGGANAMGFASAMTVAANMVNNNFMSDLKQSVEASVAMIDIQQE